MLPTYNPYARAWTPVFRQFDEMFNELLGPATPMQGMTDDSPAYDVQETDDHYLLSFDVPGVARDDINIELIGTKLTVAGERKVDGDRRRLRSGKLQVTFTLPEGVSAEMVEATHKDGVLTLAVQKPAAVRPSKIKIGDGAAKGGFIRNLIGDKKTAKEPVEIKQDNVAMAN
jgi:HSP20 family protein